MIPNFRPHMLQYQVVTPGYEDDHGDYHAGGYHFSVTIPCRFESEGRADTKTFADGELYINRYIVYLDQDCRDFKCGEVVRLIDNDIIIAEAKVIGFLRGQLNAKLWI